MSSCCSPPELDPKATDCCGNQKNSRVDWIFWISIALVLFAYLGHLFFTAQLPASLATFCQGVFELMNKMWWGILFGILALGLIGKIPRHLVQGALGKGGTLNGILRACGAGLILDLCNHGILMVGAKLYERGASLGQIFAFLIASPWNSFSMTLILISLVGFKWTALFILGSTLIAIITGLLTDLFIRKSELPGNPNTLALEPGFSLKKEALTQWKNATFDKKFFTSALKTAFSESRMILRWILFGTLLAAALRAFIPADTFSHWFGPSLAGLALTLVGATIIEVCSEGSSPIAADLLNRAAAPGNGFAFLMAGASTDYTEIAVLRETTKSWKLTFLLPLLTLPQIILISLIFNSLSP